MITKYYRNGNKNAIKKSEEKTIHKYVSCIVYIGYDSVSKCSGSPCFE